MFFLFYDKVSPSCCKIMTNIISRVVPIVDTIIGTSLIIRLYNKAYITVLDEKKDELLRHWFCFVVITYYFF